MMHTCLSIAGFDGSGGAGIQADLKTFSAFGCYGMTVLTALPIQNTCGVRHCYDLPLSAIEAQLMAIFDDIMPDSIKIGMLFSAPIVSLVATFLKQHAKNIPIVLDPVMIATSGDQLLLPDAIEVLKTKLIPQATIITPNLPEAYNLCGTIASVEGLGNALLSLGGHAVLLKGGHGAGKKARDLYIDNQGHQAWLTTNRIKTNNTHGTGCTLSAAICAGLAMGLSLIDACQQAKQYLYQALLSGKTLSIGKGKGPVNHLYHLAGSVKTDR